MTTKTVAQMLIEQADLCDPHQRVIFACGLFRSTPSDVENYLVIAIVQGKQDVLEFIMACVEYWGVEMINYSNCIKVALEFNAFRSLEIMMRFKFNLEYQSTHGGKTILQQAIEYKNIDLLKAVVHKGAHLHRKSLSGDSMLHVAVGTGDINIIQEFLRYDPSRYDLNRWGETPLQLAIRLHRLDIVTLLLQNETNPDTHHCNPESTCNPFLSYLGDLEAVKLVLRYGGRPDTLLFPESIFHFFVGQKISNLAPRVSLLLKAGVPINQLDNSGASALCRALKKNDEKLAEVLLKNDADFELKWRDQTPLMCAVEGSSEDMIRKLLKLGADITPKDNFGNTAMKIAYLKQQEPRFRILLDAHDKRNTLDTADYFEERHFPLRTGYSLIEWYAERIAQKKPINLEDIRRLRSYHPDKYNLFWQYKMEQEKMFQIKINNSISYGEVYHKQTGVLLEIMRTYSDENIVFEMEEQIKELFPIFYIQLWVKLYIIRLNIKKWKQREGDIFNAFEGQLPWVACSLIARCEYPYKEKVYELRGK